MQGLFAPILVHITHFNEHIARALQGFFTGKFQSPFKEVFTGQLHLQTACPKALVNRTHVKKRYVGIRSRTNANRIAQATVGVFGTVNAHQNAEAFFTRFLGLFLFDYIISHYFSPTPLGQSVD